MSQNNRKVAIFGAGHVGSHVAYALAIQHLADEIVLIDPPAPEKARAQALDIADAIAAFPARTSVHSGETTEAADADIVVIAAGPLPRFEDGELDRMDTLEATTTALEPLLSELTTIGVQGIIVSISNPADVIAGYLAHRLQLPPRRVLSTGTGLDSARLRRALATSLNVDQHSIDAYMLGEHGESQFAAWSQVRIGGVPLDNYVNAPNQEQRWQLETAARTGGWTVLGGKGSTEFGIGSVAARLIRAILRDERSILAVSAYLDGEYGEDAVFASVPALIGRTGVLEVLELPLTSAERVAFSKSAQILRTNLERLIE